MNKPSISIGLAAIIIQDAAITDSEKKDLASRILRLFKVERYLYVIRKLAELTMEAIKVIATIDIPMSVLPIKVYLVREEKGVTIAQPGSKSLAFFSTTQITSFSLT